MGEEKNKRELAMVRTVFNQEHLEMLKSGVNALLDIYLEIVRDKGKAGWTSTAQLKARLNKVDKQKWNSIRMNILEDEYNGDATLSGEKQSAELTIDLIKTFNSGKELILHKLEEYNTVQEEQKEKLKDAEVQLQELDKQLSDTRWQHSQDKASLTSVKAAKSYLEKANQEKREKIGDLQKEATVQLWAKEKQRFIEKNHQKLKETEEMLEKVTSERDALVKKLRDMEDNIRIQKLKSDIEEQPKSSKDASETYKLKQQVYMMHKDIVSLEQDIHNQQKYTVGILHGISFDYMDIFEGPLERNEDVLGPYSLQRCKDLSIIVRSAWEAASTGKLGSLRANLPDRYIAVDKDVKMSPTRKISTAYYNRDSQSKDSAPQVNGVKTQITESHPFSTEPQPLSNGNGIHPESSSIPPSTTPVPTKSVPPLHKHGSMKVVGHPQFVDPRTGYIDMIAVMKRFPHMTQTFVREHWEQFCHYDTDGDFSLDLSELESAITTTLGQKYTATQIHEALMEVDCDGSNDIDFFEYLSVANMLMHKQGRAQVFRSPYIQKEARHISKTCSIQ